MDFHQITPEEAGIPSVAILKYLNKLEENRVNLHGFLMLKGKEILVEGYYPPFHEKYIHRMYSVSKSFTSLAIGYLVEEGKIHLEDKICSYFKDKQNTTVHPYIEAMTIRDMLRMATAHNNTTYKRYEGEYENDWVKSFFALEPSHMPGTVFAYDTSSSHVLAALVERLSGTTVLGYLRGKLLNSIGFSKDARWLTDPMGVTQGGTGLLCTMRDLATVAYVCMKDGELDGKTLIPKDYIKEATRKQISTNAALVPDEQLGYGYQFWMARHGGFAFYGMGGQLALCFPKYDFVYVTTGDTQGSQVGLYLLYDAFYEYIYPYLENNQELQEDNNAYAALKDKLAHLKTAAVVGKKVTAITEKVANKVFIMDENKMGIQTFKLELSGDTGKIVFSNKSGHYEIPFGFGGYETVHKNGYDIMSSGAFVQENELHIICYLLGDCLANVKAVISFNNNYVTINSKKAAEGMLSEFEGFACGSIA